MIKNMEIEDKKEQRKRIILFILIGVICVIAIIITMIFQIKELETPNPIEEEKEEVVEILNFNSIFDNQLNNQDYTIKQPQKLDDNEQIVYTNYEKKEQVEGKYDIDVKIPTINIDNSVTENVNKEIEDIFREKARNVINNDEDYGIIYTVEYTAYVNENILSLVIRSNLKEGSNAQRVIVKTYTYNLSTDELIDINEMLSIKKLDKSKVEKSIIEVVTENAKQNESLISLGYNVYQRDLTSEMYEVENISNFFYGPNGVLYIIFAYGNNNYTSELDVIPIT